VYVQNFESHIQFADQYVPHKVTSGAENFVLLALQFQKQVSAMNCQTEQA
jgi:hypothetical protein